MRERRRYQRHELSFPVRLDMDRRPNRIGLCRNSSVLGMLFGTPTRMAAGERLALRFRVTLSQPQQSEVAARVVRVDLDTNVDSWCPRLVAVEFDRPMPDLDEMLRREAARQLDRFGSIMAPAPPPSSN